jgi:hypothetical protein
MNSCKQLGESKLLHGRNAHDLQNFPERLRQVQPALGDGYEQIGPIADQICTRTPLKEVL